MVPARLAIGVWLFVGTGCSAETRVSFFENAGGVLTDAAGGDSARGDSAPESGPAVALIHRYDFEGTGTTVVDRAGGAHGTVRGGATLDGAGGLVLDGRDDYVDLPNRLISRLNSGTFVVWLTWYGGVCWHRIFDFGSTLQGEDVVGDGTSNVFVTPLDCPGPGPLAMFGTQFDGGGTEVVVRTPIPFPTDGLHQVALVVEGDARLMRFYIDAQSHGEVALRVGFESIDDVNNWLGRSQWIQDDYFRGRYEEFRIYSTALRASEITGLYHAGPDAP